MPRCNLPPATAKRVLFSTAHAASVIGVGRSPAPDQLSATGSYASTEERGVPAGPTPPAMHKKLFQTASQGIILHNLHVSVALSKKVCSNM